MNDNQLRNLLHSAFPELDCPTPSRDLWPSIVDRIQAPATWSWIDISVAACIAAGISTALVLLPKAVLLLAYQL